MSFSKTTKIIIATIIVIGGFALFYFFQNKSDEKNMFSLGEFNLPESFFVDDETEIKFEWTDDNKGEDLIIQSDKKSYFGINKSEIYFSVSSLNKDAQNFNLRFLFGEESAKLEKIEKINSGGITSELSLSENTFVKFDSMDGFSSSLYVGDIIQPEQTNYYKAVIAYNPNTKGEFYIEAKGDKGAYGLLDPWYNSTGLVGYWSFDGNDMDWSATTAEVIDRSGQGNHGDATNMTSASVDIGKVGQALVFDGVDDSISIGIGTDYFPMDTFSMCSWVKSPGLADGMTLNGILSITYGLSISLDNSGRFLSRMDDGVTAISVSAGDNLADNEWHWVCLTFDGINRHMFVDGVNKLSTPTTWLGTTRWPTNAGNIGYENNNKALYKFNGSIDEVLVYNRALSVDEISALYKLGTRKSQVKTTGSNKMKINTSTVNRLTDGLVGHWTFDGADMDWSSTTAEVLDRSGNENNGNVFGETKSAIGKIGQALEFNGQNDYVLFNNPQITGSEVSTFVSWFKVDDPSRLQMILYWGNFSDYLGMMQVIHVSTAKCGGTYNTINYWVDTETVVAGEWNHLACVYDGTNVLAYLNGVYYGSNVYPAAVTSSSLYLSRYDATKYFNGSIDEVRIYNRVLSPTEITELYNMGAKKIKIR